MLRRANIYCVKFRGDTSREDGVKKEKLFEAKLNFCVKQYVQK